MAERTDVYLIDDLHAHQNPDEPAIDAEETVEFGYQGRTYEIDLTKANAEKLHDALAPFVAAARVLGRTVKPKGTSTRSASSAASARSRNDRDQSQAIRDWARSRKMKVSDRGRIPKEVLEAFHQAHPQSA